MTPLLSSNASMLLMIAMMAALFYFMIQRPMKRRAQEAAKMTDSLEPGTRVLLSGGFLGTVLHKGEKQAIVELAPGVEVTVLKQAILKPLSPADEEFEYEDDDLSDRGDDALDEVDDVLVGADVDDVLVGAEVATADEGDVAGLADDAGNDEGVRRDGTATN